MGAHVIEVNADNWESEVVRSDVPVLVDFWAPWCAPCQTLSPVLDELAGELTGRLKIAKVNIKENPRLADRFGVRSIPNLILLAQGGVKGQWTGSLTKSILQARLEPYLG